MILTIGSYGAGITVTMPRIPDAGETMGGAGIAIGHGGKSSNQAVAAARQGAQVEIVSTLGPDSFAESARQLWQSEGIAHDLVKTDEAATMAGIIMVEPSGENRIAIAPGALDNLTPHDIDERIAAIERADVVVVCLEVPAPTIEHAIKRAKELGKTVILNPAPAAELGQDAIAAVDYFIPNSSEYAFYRGLGYEPPAGQVCILTRGGDGVTIRRGAEEEGVPPLPQTDVVDTTGAGDTFVGTFAAAIDSGLDVTAAAERAVVASSLCVTRAEVIPSIPTSSEVDQALARYRNNR